MIDFELDRSAGLHTYRGYPVFYGDPSQTPVDVRDLEVHLKNSRRYAGVLDVPIFLHLCYCVELAAAIGLSPITCAYVACHDMHEAYIGDIPTGLKKYLTLTSPTWNAMEETWEAHVHDAFDLPFPLPPEEKARVKLVDMLALLGEMTMNDHPAVGLVYQRATVRKVLDDHPEYLSLLRPCWKRAKKMEWEMLASVARNATGGILLRDAYTRGEER